MVVNHLIGFPDLKIDIILPTFQVLGILRDFANRLSSLARGRNSAVVLMVALSSFCVIWLFLFLMNAYYKLFSWEFLVDWVRSELFLEFICSSFGIAWCIPIQLDVDIVLSFMTCWLIYWWCVEGFFAWLLKLHLSRYCRQRSPVCWFTMFLILSYYCLMVMSLGFSEHLFRWLI